ncbi:E3 ubiquitin-protein ligase TRAIP [Anthonomus grandis grandis]|uniref:E3 ubiquitin-protein ligase TRAIP n=1 Tax=Anthonomus grandis grandis TaxID=2921223 RepID=UPI0021656C3A|nr:E3 ubiquitin-protein ligase TRAIP [Anthonomus grandis grandis]
MNIICPICSDFLTPLSDIYSTPCGHIFHYTCLIPWFENSKTCPQCRTKVTNKQLVRLFVTQSSGSNEVDCSVLQNKIENLEWNMKLKDQEVKSVGTKNKELSTQNKNLRQYIKKLEADERGHESVIVALKDQIKFFKTEAQQANKYRDEAVSLRNELKNVELVQKAVSSTRSQVEDLIRNETSIDNLALLAATLKKSLIDTTNKKLDYQCKLKKTQNELSQEKRKFSELKCQYNSVKKELDTLQINYQKEVAYLKEKFTQLQEKANSKDESLSRSIKRIVSESPVNYNRTPVLTERKEEVIDLSESLSLTPPCSGTSQSKRNENKELDELQDDSPLPASSMGIFGIQRSKTMGLNKDPSKFSIFKPRTSVQQMSIKPNFKRPDTSYDGFGGSNKEEIFPTSQATKRLKTSKSSASSRFKKMSAEAGKANRKMEDFLNKSS